MNVPTELHYAESHEWLRLDADGTATVGITDHAQAALGDLVYIELPTVGRIVASGEACAVVESVKAASDVYAPIAGEVIEGNPALADDPSLVNRDPEGEGWFFKMTLADKAELDGLMDEAAYRTWVATL